MVALIGTQTYKSEEFQVPLIALLLFDTIIGIMQLKNLLTFHKPWDDLEMCQLVA